MTPFQQTFFATLAALIPFAIFIAFRERKASRNASTQSSAEYRQALQSLEGVNQYTPQASVKPAVSHYHLIKLPGVSVKVPATSDIKINHNHAIETPVGLTRRMRETLNRAAHQ
jgi:hypothetical protein